MSITTELQHPLLACVAAVEAALDEVADVQPTYMTPTDKERAAVALERLERRIEGQKLRVLACAEDVAEQHGARDVASWFAHATRAEPAIVRSDVDLAKAMDTRWARVQDGLGSGSVSAHQARVIAHALAELPSTAGPDVVASAERTLVGYADRHRPSELRRIGRRILDVVAPEIAEEEEAKRLQAEEERAREKASLRFRPRGDGTTAFSGVLPDSAAARWRTYLEAFTSPRHPDNAPGVQEGDRIPSHRKRAHAFVALLERLDPSQLPEHSGDATTVIVTITHEQLLKTLGVAGLLDDGLDAGANLSAAQARRLACTAQILPVVLGGRSEVLDQGRVRRLYTKAQRRAARLRDRTCLGEGCDVPAAWTEIHHDKPWSRGGRTDLDDARCYCSHHHHLVHDPRYSYETLPNGRTRFHRRP